MDMDMNCDDVIAQTRQSQNLVDAARLSQVDVGP